MTNCWRAFITISFTSLIVAEAVNSCSVQPSATVVVVGKTVSLNCTATGNFPIFSWQIGTDVNNKTVVYNDPLFGRNKTITRSQYVADGYSVTNAAENKISLHINQTSFSQAGLYVCQCEISQTGFAKAAVVVLASEPKFSVISNVTNGKPVIFSCNISFNGSTDISSNLTIKDISGNTVNSTDCSAKNGVTSCNLKYTITANASVDQSYSCAVHLIRNNNTIYSRSVGSSLEWQRVSNAEIVVSDQRKCSPEKCNIRESITCKANGNPGTTAFKWWKIVNGSEWQMIGESSQSIMLNEIGHFTYQCQAYNTIRGVNNSATSKPFPINVQEKDNTLSMPIVSVIGISVAIGLIVIVIAIVVTRILCSRKRKNESFRALSTTDTSSDVPQRPPANRYDKTKVKNPAQQGFASTAPSHPAAPNDNKTSVGNDVVVFDNDLYEGARCASPNPTVPSAGYMPEEAIYNEIHVVD